MSHIFIETRSKWATYFDGNLGGIEARKMGYHIHPIVWMSPESIQQYMLNYPSYFSNLNLDEKDFSENVAVKGIHIMCGNNYRGGYENEHMSLRGYHDLIGDVVFFAETIGSDAHRDPIDTNMSMILVEAILSVRGKTLVDCMVHEFRRRDNHRVKLNKYVNKTKMTTEFSDSVLASVLSRGRLVVSPDDSPDIQSCELSCVTCGSYEKVDSMTCECMRATYCNEKCRMQNWGFHCKFIHTPPMG